MVSFPLGIGGGRGTWSTTSTAGGGLGVGESFQSTLALCPASPWLQQTEFSEHACSVSRIALAPAEFSEHACSVSRIALAPAETARGSKAAPSGVDRGRLEAGAGNTVGLPALWLLFLPT